MPPQLQPSHFPVSLFATASPAHQDVFYTVPRAGHLVGGPDHHIKRDHFPGHELILCLRGRGWVRVAGQTHAVGAGELVWINCHQPHEHGSLTADPWEVYWVRIEGPGLERIGRLLAVATSPVLRGFDAATARPLFPRVFELMQDSSPEAPAMIHAEVARLVALAFCSRAARAGQGDSLREVPAALRASVQAMKLFYFEPHRVADLAAGAGMSAVHFNRVFKRTFGTSPIDWLRRERINQAKRRLVETDDTIGVIGEQVGYRDRFYFSKDFKRITGLTPGGFRRRERLRRLGDADG